MLLLETSGQDQQVDWTELSPRHLYKERLQPLDVSAKKQSPDSLGESCCHTHQERKKQGSTERGERNGKARCSLHVRHGIAPRGLCIRPNTKCGGHRRVLRHERQQPPAAEHGGEHVQAVRHLVDAAVRAGPGRAAGRGRHGHPRGGGRAERRAVEPGRQPGRGGRLGAQQHPGLPVRLLPVRVRGKRGRRRRGVEPGAGHGERARGAGGGGAGPHQGDHVGVAGHPGRVHPAVRGAVHRRGAGVHGPGAGLPGAHGGPAHGQHLPVPRMGVEPQRHGHALRALHLLGDRGPGRGLRVPEPVRHHRGRVLRRHGQARRLGGAPRRVRDRVAVGRRHGGQPVQRQGVQSVPGEPRREGHAAAPGGHRDVPLLHVQREPEGERRGAELGALLPQHEARLPHQLQLVNEASSPYVSQSVAVGCVHVRVPVDYVLYRATAAGW